MKISIKNLLSAAAIGSVVLFVASACGDKATFDAVTAADGARVKFLHAIINPAFANTAANYGQPRITVYANDKKFSAFLNTSTTAVDSMFYSNLYPSLDYAVLPAGATKFNVKQLTLFPGTPKDTTLLSFDVNLEANKYYTIIGADSVTKAKGFAITDDRSALKNALKSYVRFVNVGSGAPGVYEFYLRRQASTTTLLSTVKYGEAGAYVEIDPYPLTASPAINDSIFIRIPGQTTNFIALNLGSIFAANRIRTLVLSGTQARPLVNSFPNN